MEPREVRRFRIWVQELKNLVAVVATLGELVATVTAPRRDVQPLLYPESLYAALWNFSWTLRDTLRQCSVTFLRQRRVASLRQAVAALKATPGAPRADVRAAARAWRESMDALDESWGRVEREAEELFNTLEGEDTAEATNEDPAEAAATGLAGDLQDETPPGRGTAGDNLVAAAPQPSVALPSAVAAHDVPVGRGQAGAAARRGQRVEEVQELLGRLFDACEVACSWLPYELHDWLRSIETAQEGTYKIHPDDLEYFMVDMAKFEWLYEASGRLARRHLLGTLRDIQRLLSSPRGGSGGPGGPGGRAVAERCQRAIEDIPRLLGGQ